MKKISELQNKILLSISNCCLSLGFTTESSPTFYSNKNDIIRILHVDFLNKQNSSYFNSNTASFSLNLGLFFNFDDETSYIPKEDEAQIRGHLLKDFRQKSPMNLKGFSLFHPERRRRDIWWVEPNGTNIEYLLNNATRIIKMKAIKWLDKYSDIDFVIDFLKTKKGTEVWQEGPWIISPIGSQYRIDLIEKLKLKKG